MDEHKTVADMVYDVIVEQHDYILKGQQGSKEIKEATESFNNSVKNYRDLQKDTDDFELEKSRIDNEAYANRKAEAERAWFDKYKIAIEAVGVVGTVAGVVMSYVVLKNYQEINMNSVITNKDAVGAADKLFNSLCRKLG